MRLPLKDHQRRILIPALGICLAAYYLFVLNPLVRRAQRLDEPLQKSKLKLLVALDQTNATSIDFQRITNQLIETHQALQILQKAREQARARLQLGTATRTKVFSDFELVDYESERSKQLDVLRNLAKQQQVTVDPTVFDAFPMHTADVRQPSLLWAALSLTEGLVHTALQCKVTAIQSLDVAPVLTNAPPTNGLEQLAQIPIQIEFTGPAASAARLLQCLPLRSEEIRAAGLPEAPPDKVPLFVDRLILQKQSPDKPDEVHVWLRALGFVLRE